MNVLPRAGFAHFLELLRYRADAASGTADQLAFTYLDDGEQVSATLTYAQLDRRARQLAAQLQQRCRPGERVLLVYAPGIDYILGFFACVYAGVVAVPALPPANARTLPRLLLIARDAQAVLALTSAAIGARLSQWQAQSDEALGRLPWLDADAATGQDAEWTAPQLSGDDIAFLQYTSGSTGAPKGVMVSHANMLANVDLIHQRFGLAPGQNVVSWLPPHHDMGLIGKILYPVYAGSHCVQLPPATFLVRPYRWLKALSDYRARITAAPNFAYELCVEKVSEADKATLDLSALAFALNGAEPVRADTVRRFAAAFAGCGLRADAMTPVYGLAESTLLVTASGAGEPQPLRVDRDALAGGRAVAGAAGAGHGTVALMSSGAAWHGHQVLIVDPERAQQQPEASVGEIWVGGASVAQGYWQRPQESAQTFGATLAGRDGRYLRTGDLGFLLDGQLYLTGRIKDMMIFSGRNVYPQDVEATVEAVDPAFRAHGCAAFSVEREGAQGTQLVIVQEVRARQQVQFEPMLAALRAAVAEQHELVDLAAVVLIKAGRLPRTSSNKVRRQHCRELFLRGEFEPLWSWHAAEPAAEPAAAGQRAARTPTERLLAELWGRLLGRAEPLSVDANFFALGGHSLLATQVLSQVRAAFGVELTLRTLFEAPTIAQLARSIEHAGREAGARSAPAIVARARTAPAPLSFAQQRLWLLDRMEAASSVYNIGAVVRLAGRLDEAALTRTLNEIVGRHEALRTTFAEVDGAAAQIIAPALALTLARHDLSALPPAEREAKAMWLAQDAAQAPFDLRRGPLLRAGLLRLQPQQHLLHLSLHHIVTDGWSMGVLVAEIGALYGAYAQGQPSPLAPLAVQYADFAHWQRQWLEGAELARQLGYWRGQLAGAPTLLSLPTDRARPQTQSHRGATLPFTVPAAVTAALQALAQRSKGTLFMTLAAAFNVLLARYAGQDDICIGTPIANRQRAELEPLIGFFVNTLVLRTRVDSQAPFERLLAQVRETTLDAYAHQDLPFDQLVDALNPERHASHAPLFQAMLVLQNAPMPALALPELSLQTAQLDGASAKFDLTLTFTPQGEQLGAAFEYATDLFDAATVARMAGHFTRLLEAIVADPARPVGGLAMLDASERRQLLVDWNDTARPYPQGQTIHQLFEAQAARAPAATALVCGGAALTYAELNAQANRLAHHLRARGVGPDVLVGLCVERCFDMVVGLLAILKAGGAYVPLDPAYPRQRLAYMLEDAAPALLLTQQHLLERLPALALPLLCLDRDWNGLEGDAANPAPLAQPEHLAYVIYTSGSTGQPKGVAVSLRNVVRLVCNSDYFTLTAGQRVLQFAPVAFDASTFEIWGALLNGATLVLAPQERLSSAALGGLITAERIDTMWLTAALFNQMVEDQLPALTSVGHLLAGGEALSAHHVRQFLAAAEAAASGARLTNGYGPTEGTTFTCCHLLPDHAEAGASVPIGRPIANTEVYLLDARLRPVPVGVAGELYLSGAGLARGYLNRPELTAEKFLPHPFSATPGARMYRTGDLARYLPDGNIEYLGRIDQQVKLRGFRIELGEIEAALSALPAVREAVVLAREDAAGDKRLVAYLVAQHGAAAESALQAGALRTALLHTLPDYMVPAHFVLLEQLPLSPTGKLDRQALPAPDMTRDEGGYVAPRTATETVLADIWSQVLKRERVGVHDNFFELGGNSLLAVQAITRLPAEFQMGMSMRNLFEITTIAALASKIDAAGGDASTPADSAGAAPSSTLASESNP